MYSIFTKQKKRKMAQKPKRKRTEGAPDAHVHLGILRSIADLQGADLLLKKKNVFGVYTKVLLLNTEQGTKGTMTS